MKYSQIHEIISVFFKISDPLIIQNLLLAKVLNWGFQKNRSMSVTSPTALCPVGMATPSPATKIIQAGPAFSMLQKLVSEADSRFVAVHEEVSEHSLCFIKYTS